VRTFFFEREQEKIVVNSSVKTSVTIFFYGYVKTHAHCVSPVQFVFYFPIIRPYLLWNLTLAKKLLVNDKIHSFVTNKYVSRALYLNLQTTEINFEKFLG